jgi:hypothetical protein
MSKEELRDRVNLGPEVFYSVLGKLAEEKKLEVAGELVHLPGRGVVMKDEEAESKKIIEQAFASAGLKVPSLKEVLAGLKVDKIRAQKIVTLLIARQSSHQDLRGTRLPPERADRSSAQDRRAQDSDAEN